MNVYRIEINTTRTVYEERSTHLVQAPNAATAIRKAANQAKKEGMYKNYDAVSLELVGDPL